MKDLIENYKSTYKKSGANKKDWYVSPMSVTPLKQIQVKLNKGKAYEYACRFDVKDGAVAVIGCGLPVELGDHCFPSVNTGSMGSVEKVAPKLTIKRNHAVEVDYIFNTDPQKTDLSRCVKYLKFGPESYDKTIRFDKGIHPIRPITYFARRILAAASILAHPTLVTKQDLITAEEVILQNLQIDSAMLLSMPTPGIALFDVQIPDTNVMDLFKEIAKDLESHKDWDAESGILEWLSGISSKMAELKSVNDFVSKYAHEAAVAIMVRGGFKNLLKAYLSVNPPIDKYCSEMRVWLDGIGDAECFEMLQHYHK